MVRLEGDHADADSELRQPLLLLPQLRQMLPARESAKVPVEDEQQPMAQVIPLAVNLALRVGQLERYCRMACLVLHGLKLRFGFFCNAVAAYSPSRRLPEQRSRVSDLYGISCRIFSGVCVVSSMNVRDLAPAYPPAIVLGSVLSMISLTPV